MDLPVDVEVHNQGPHHVSVEYEWLNKDGVQLLVPADSEFRLRVVVTLLDACSREQVQAGGSSSSEASGGLLGGAVLGEQLTTATGLLDELIVWFGAPDWQGPQVPVDLARRIAGFFADQADA